MKNILIVVVLSIGNNELINTLNHIIMYKYKFYEYEINKHFCYNVNNNSVVSFIC
jgi:hypothetical protein